MEENEQIMAGNAMRMEGTEEEMEENDERREECARPQNPPPRVPRSLWL